VRLLDTDTCVEILRGNASVLEHRSKVHDVVVTSWVTAAELYYGAAKSRQPSHNQAVVTRFLATLDILGLDSASAQLFGENKAALEGGGRRLADADLMIAAVAQSRGAVLVTGNRRHYARISGLAIENWIR
jgi:tRNA(fMet)-specific endonuclease VapC